MRYFAGFLLAVAISVGLAAPAAAGQAPVTMAGITGVVLVKLFPGYRARFARRGMPLFYGSRLLLLQGARVRLLYENGYVLILTSEGNFIVGPPPPTTPTQPGVTPPVSAPANISS